MHFALLLDLLSPDFGKNADPGECLLAKEIFAPSYGQLLRRVLQQAVADPDPRD